MREEADIVIVGAGIVGTSAAHFLAEKGWKNIVVMEQGPLFETGGSTSHAPGLVFELNSSKTLCQLSKWSVETYRSLEWRGLPCFYSVGSLEIANCPERWQDLKVKCATTLVSPMLLRSQLLILARPLEMVSSLRLDIVVPIH